MVEARDLATGCGCLRWSLAHPFRLAERDLIREAPRMQYLIDRYLREHVVRLAPVSVADQKSMMEKMIAPHWGRKLVTEITRSDVEKLLAKVAGGRARPHKVKPNTPRRG